MALTEPAGNIFFGLLHDRVSKNLPGGAEFNDFPFKEEGGVVRDPGRLLHVVSNDGDGVGAF